MSNLKRNIKIYSAGIMTVIYFLTNVTPLFAGDVQPIQQDATGQFVPVVDPDSQHYDRSFGAQLGQVPAVEKFEEIKPLSPAIDEEIKVRCDAMIPQCGYNFVPEPVLVEKPIDSLQPLNPANSEDRANIFEAGQIFGTLPAYMSSEYQKDGSTKYSFYDASKNLLGSKLVTNQYIYDLRYYPQERPDVVLRGIDSSLALDKTTVADVMMPPYEYKFHEAETWFAADGTKLDETNNEYLNAPQFVRDAAKNLARNLPSSLRVSVFTANDGSYGIRIDNIDSETAGKPGAFESIIIKFKSGNLESDGVKTLPEVESIQIQFTGRDLDQDATNALLDSARQLVRAGVADVISGSQFSNQSGKSILDSETQAALVLVSQMNAGRIRSSEPGKLNFKIGELGFQVKYGADQETFLTIKNPELQALVDFISKLQGQLKGYSFHVSKNEDGSYHVSVTGRDGLKYDLDKYEPICLGWRCGGYQPAQLNFDLKFENGKLSLVDGSLKFQREQYYGWFYKVESLYGTFETNADELIFRGLMRLGRESGLSGADQLASALAGLMRSTEPQQVEIGGVTHTLFSVDGQNFLLRSRKNLLSAEKITVERAQQLSALINFVREAGYYLQPNSMIKITGINADGTYSVRVERNETPAAGDFSAMNFRVEFKDGSWQMKAGTAAVVFSGFTLSAAAVQGLIDGLRSPPAPAYQLHLAALLGELTKIKIQSVNTATGVTVFSRGGFDYELVRVKVDGVFKYSVRVHATENMVDLGNGQWLKINANHPLAQVILQKLKDGQVTWNFRYDSYGNFTFEHEGVVYTIGANSAYWVAPGYWYVAMIQATTAEGMITYQYFNQDGTLYHTQKRFYKQYADGSSLEQYFYADGTVSSERRRNADSSYTDKSFSQDGKLTYQSDVAADGSIYSRSFNDGGQITSDYRRAADGTESWSSYTYAEVNGAQKLVRVITSRRDAGNHYSSEDHRIEYDAQNRVIGNMIFRTYVSSTTGETIYAFSYEVWNYETNQITVYSSESNLVNFADQIQTFSDTDKLIAMADLKRTVDYKNIVGPVDLMEIRFYGRKVDGNWNDKPYQIQRDGKNYAFIDDQLIPMVDQEVLVDGKPAKVVWQTPYHTRLADGTFGLKKMALLLTSNDGSFSAEIPMGSTVSIGGINYEIKMSREDGKIQLLPLDSSAVTTVRNIAIADLIKTFGFSAAHLQELIASGLIKIEIDLDNLTMTVLIDPSVKLPAGAVNLFDPLGSNFLPSNIHYTLGKSLPLIMGVPCSVSADGTTDCAKEPEPVYFLKSGNFNVGAKIFRASYLPEMVEGELHISLEGPGDNRLFSVTITSREDNCQGDVCTNQYIEIFVGMIEYKYSENGKLTAFVSNGLKDESGKRPLGRTIQLELTEDGTYRISEVKELDAQGNVTVVSRFNYAPDAPVCDSSNGQNCPMVMPPLYRSGNLMRIDRVSANGALLLSTITMEPFTAGSATIKLANGTEDAKLIFVTLEDLLMQARNVESKTIPESVTNYVNELQLQVGNGFKVTPELQADGTYLITVVRHIDCPADAMCMPRMMLEGEFVSLNFKLSAEGIFVPDSINAVYQGFEVDAKLIFEGLRRILSQVGITSKDELYVHSLRYITDAEVLKAMTEIVISEKDSSGAVYFSRSGSDYKVYRDENGNIRAEKLLPKGGLPVPEDELAIVMSIFGNRVRYMMMTSTGCQPGDIVCIPDTGATYYDEDGHVLGFKNIAQSEFESADHTKLYHYGDLTGQGGKGITGITFTFSGHQSVRVDFDYTNIHQYPVHFKAVEAAVMHLLNTVEVSSLKLKNYQNEPGMCTLSIPGFCSSQVRFSLESDEAVYRYEIDLRTSTPSYSDTVTGVRLLDNPIPGDLLPPVISMPVTQSDSASELMEKIRKGEIAGYTESNDDEEDKKRKTQHTF